MTLTETAYYTRATIKYGILAIIAFFVLRLILGVSIGIYQHFFPPPPPAAEARFGKLPKLLFDPKEGTSFTFSLQTPTGELPSDLPPLVDVYFMPTSERAFLNLDEARGIAQKLTFTGEEEKLSDIIYRFKHPNYGAVLDINIVNKTFAISYDLNQDKELLALNILSTSQPENAVSSFLSRANLLPKDIEEGEIKPTLLKFQNDKLVEANSLSETNFIKVNLFRKNYTNSFGKAPYDTLPVLTDKKDEANVWFLVSGITSGPRQIVAGEYHYFPVSEEQKSTYKIKTAQEAWDELASGKGLIVSTPEGGGEKITIRRVYLAYYDSGKPQQFLQPVYVFDGDGGFRAYVPATTSEFYSQE